jgi:MerR family transcriptional regulator, heat shock protein HspR
MNAGDGRDMPCYVMSVAARLVELHPQTLRRYEDLGLVKPARLAGKRLYSPRDIERLRLINRLTDELGVNLAGVEIIINMTERLERLQQEIGLMQAQMEAEIAALQQAMDDHSSPSD